MKLVEERFHKNTSQAIKKSSKKIDLVTYKDKSINALSKLITNQKSNYFDYIYIDFMFEKKNNAKPSKYDLFLRSINYNENNKLNFIEEMINYCKKRIIVKEPIKSKSKIIDCDFEIKTKLIKYKIFNGKLGK